MKFEINPNELTTDQRAYVAAFITNWPHADEVDHAGEAELRRHARIYGDITEEQRLDAEQKSDLKEAVSEIGAAAAVNLNAIFGTPVDTAGDLTLTISATSTAVPLDSQGLPWDSRIHASTKTFIADGSWKLRRGVDPAEVEKVKAQLKELMAVPQALVTDLHRGASTVPVPPSPTVSVGVDLAAGTDTTVITPAPVLTPTSVGYVPVPVPKSHYLIDQQPPTAVTLTDLIGRMSAAIAAGKLTQASIAEICTKHGVSEFHLLSNRPDLLPLIDADMKAMGV